MPDAPRIVGRYAIYRKIAQGGMAAVHLGRLLGGAGFARTVAIKRLHAHLSEDPAFLSTLIDEARMCARIHHPNVVATLDVVAESGEMLVVMEYVRGESLSRLMRFAVARQQPIPLPIISAIAIDALHGLHAAHVATSDRGTPLGIVHRDVSPQNILVGVDGVARIIDFGIAKAAGRLQTTSEGIVKGKAAYIAPEQFAGSEATSRVDVYALGVVLWEMLAGRDLFSADNDAAIVAQILSGAAEPPSRFAAGVPPELDALVMTALARNRADRFASAREMADVLVHVVPPALSTDVGEWVEELAREALSSRATLLAEIESAGVTSIRPDAKEGAAADGAQRVARPDVEAHDPTKVSQPSSLALEASTPHVASFWRSRRALAVVASGAALLAAVLLWRASGTPAPPPLDAAANAEPAAAPASTSAAPALSVQPQTSTASSSATPTPPATSSSPATVGAKRRFSRPPAHSKGITRFAQPD